MSNNKSPDKIVPALLDISQICQILNMSRAEFYRLDKTGSLRRYRNSGSGFPKRLISTESKIAAGGKL